MNLENEGVHHIRRLRADISSRTTKIWCQFWTIIFEIFF